MPSQERREFAVNVSHELKTPIGALVLLAETLDSVANDPTQVRAFAEKVGTESRRLSKLIKEIIEISRLQGAESVLTAEEFATADAVAEAVDNARLAADTRAISLTLADNPNSVVVGDRDLIVMAVRNLVDNAVAYSDEGGDVTVSVSVTDEVVSISVVDRGIGISAEDQERIFERFYRTDPARSRETGGTGLGLSIVKHIAAQHGGDVELWSELGIGSTFTLRLPRLQEGIAE